ncbi:MAG: YARHG domain-containing protein [Flavobacterium sp.]
MKKLFSFLLVLTIVSCNKETKKTAMAQKESDLEIHKDLYGNWVGDFIASEQNTEDTDDFVYSNKINIVIKKIAGGKVYGQSIVAGNVSGFIGEIKEGHNELNFTLKELGDTKKEGEFIFTIKQDSLKGKWISNNKKAIVTERKYELVKQKFKYDPNLMLSEEEGPYVDYYASKTDTIVYETEGEEEPEHDTEEMYRVASDVVTKINTSTKKLTEADVKNLKKLELEILRNTIFARHGYTFKKKSYRQFFDPVSWYVPISNDVSAALTPLEKDNIALLERFEKYAEDNYDSFGR